MLPLRAMRKTDFYYKLPAKQIAQYPLARRDASRLLVLNGETGEFKHRLFIHLPSLLEPGDLLVFNDTRVIPARLFGKKETKGKVEILVERILADNRLLAQVRASKAPRAGMSLDISGDIRLQVIGRRGDFYELMVAEGGTVPEILERAGHVPLPPYISREDEPNDRERYQTVYARRPGAVAAPTAGLHFDEAMLERLGQMEVRSAYITLHVAASTFQPVREQDIGKHRMHSEYFEIGEEAITAINTAKQHNKRIIAVGTTVARALETAAGRERLGPFQGETDIFIYPGYRFRIVDAMLTNFHLPESTLLMLVCAFSEMEHVLNAYRQAIRKKYRFYSYGDAMFVTPSSKCQVSSIE